MQFVIVFIIIKCVLASEEVLVGLKCGPNGPISRQQPNTTMIRLPPLCNALYSVNTRRNKFCENCPWMTWQIIRNLEFYLNENFSETPSDGLVPIKNDMIIKGYDYFLHVTLTCLSGTEEREFSLRLFEGEEEDVTGRLDLEGGVVPGLLVIVNARVQFCEPVDFYLFKWTLFQNGTTTVAPGRSRHLKVLFPFLLTFKEPFLTITCQVIEAKSNRTLLEKAINIIIDDPPQPDYLEVFLPFKHTTFPTTSPISIDPYIEANVEYHVEWTCIFEDFLLSDCRTQQSPKFHLERGFTDPGNYSITLTVWSDFLNHTRQCTIAVLPTTPGITLRVVHPVLPANGWQVSATISQLRTYCVVEWRAPWLMDVPHIGPTIFNISSRDASFLHDIVEFGSTPTTRTYHLNIPPPLKGWILQPGNYTVNLQVSCPKEVMEVVEEVQGWLVSYGEVEVVINRMLHVDFDVTIEEYGVVYRVTKGNEGWYRFGYTWKEPVVFYECVGCTTAEAIMPFSGDTPIETWIDVCQLHGPCDRSFGRDITCDLNVTHNKATLEQLVFEGEFTGALVSESLGVSEMEAHVEHKRSTSEMDEVVIGIGRLALLDSPNATDEDQMVQLVDQWMRLGCAMVRNHQLAPKIELPNFSLYVQPELSRNQTIYVEVKNSSCDVCIGVSLYNGTTHGVGVYGSGEGVVVTMPRPPGPDVECFLYPRGLEDCTTLLKETVVECNCEEMGLIYLQVNADEGYKMNTRTQQIFYFVMGSSLMGFVILCYIIRKLAIYPQHNVIFDGFNEDNNNYAHVMYDDELD